MRETWKILKDVSLSSMFLRWTLKSDVLLESLIFWCGVLHSLYRRRTFLLYPILLKFDFIYLPHKDKIRKLNEWVEMRPSIHSTNTGSNKTRCVPIFDWRLGDDVRKYQLKYWCGCVFTNLIILVDIAFLTPLCLWQSRHANIDTFVRSLFACNRMNERTNELTKCHLDADKLVVGLVVNIFLSTNTIGMFHYYTFNRHFNRCGC